MECGFGFLTFEQFALQAIVNLLEILSAFAHPLFEFDFGLTECRFRPFPLDRIANRSQQDMAIDLSFDQIILRALLHRRNRQVLVV